MKEHSRLLEDFVHKVEKWATTKQTVLERLKDQVQDMRNPQARKLMDVEHEILYEQSKTEDHE